MPDSQSNSDILANFQGEIDKLVALETILTNLAASELPSVEKPNQESSETEPSEKKET